MLRKKEWKKGFTLVELIIVLVIIGILAAIGIPSATHFIRLAEFRKNEENAKTAYLAAEATLTWYRSSGQWEAFREKVEKYGTPNNTFRDAAAPDGSQPVSDERNGRIYAVTINREGAEASPSEPLARALLEDSSYSGDFTEAAIAIEIDIRTGQVYSAFYGTRCSRLAYDGNDEDGVLDISAAEDNRAPDNRRGRLLGYYSVEDVANVTQLKPVRLKVTTINLVNGETLSLNWTSNSRHDNLDVKYIISFCCSDNDEKLFFTEVDREKLKPAETEGGQLVRLKLKRPDGGDGTDIGEWAFPLSYQSAGGSGGRFSLVLDGMMTAELMEALDSVDGVDAKRLAMQEYSTSITRLGAVAGLEDLGGPLDIYATIEAQPIYGAVQGEFTEYIKSGEVKSNVENTLYSDCAVGDDGAVQAGISRFRHLSNMRYFDETAEACFTLTARNLDWTASGVGMYGMAPGGEGGEGASKFRSLKWNSSAQGGAVLDFPSMALLPAGHTLQGERGSNMISHLRLGADSVADDSLIKKLYPGDWEAHAVSYLGLFGETEGTVRRLTLSDPVLELTGPGGGAAEGFGSLYGAGTLSGRSQGVLEDISVRTSAKEFQIVEVCLEDRETGAPAEAADERPAGIGGLVGVLAGKDGSGGLVPLNRLASGAGTAPSVSGLSVEGAVRGVLPAPAGRYTEADDAPEHRAVDYSYGVGGIFGYALLGDGSEDYAHRVAIRDCSNHAGVTGNLFTGGIAGYVRDNIDIVVADGSVPAQDASSIVECSNDGLVLCSADYGEEEGRLEGRYFGGILGFGVKVQIQDCASASGRAKGYRYTLDQRETVLLGQYVGGIIGYGDGSQLAGCRTEKNGYVLGSDYVGGIAGGLSNDAREAITGTAGIAVTTNAGYVIGNSYVGGIVGKNDGDRRTTLTNCINNGVAAGYERYIGGIAGYNGEKGYLLDCASYLSDYDGSLLRTIVDEWKATGDCAGGLVGYNNGEIVFTAESEKITVKSVSGIVVGKDYVGGVIGFNDSKGMLDVAYTLIGGRIHAYGNGAGGCIGLNASTEVLTQSLSIKPVSVTGNYYVGGCIGANVVDLVSRTRVEAPGGVTIQETGPQDVAMDGFRADNTLGSITGSAFVGGVIGYQRTYVGQQLGGGEVSLLDYLDRAQKGEVQPLLPQLDGSNVPTAVLPSANTHILTIGNSDNTAQALVADNNNIPVYCNLYTGGIVGYCERSSRLAIVNCRNGGGLSKREDGGDSGKVSLRAYLLSQEMDADVSQLEGDILVTIGGGIIGSNLDGQVIDHCVNSGTMNGFVGLGGIVGCNAGGVFNCELSDNFGNAGLDYIGGIAGLNVKSGAGQKRDYTDVNDRTWSYESGIVAGCRTRERIKISGASYVGGIAGYNLSGAQLVENVNRADVSGAGNYVGGMAGANSGTVLMAQSGAESGYEISISGNNGIGIGGIVGWNRPGGSVSVLSGGSSGPAVDVVAVGGNVSIVGREKVGGVIGVNEGSLTASGSGAKTYLVCRAKLVRATQDCAGGIIGEVSAQGANGSGTISQAVNQAERVTADNGRAGGIVAVNGAGFTISDCLNAGNVNSDQGYAGGIAAENDGEITDCSVGDDGTGRAAGDIRISSQGADAIGAVCAVNRGHISRSGPVRNRADGPEVVLSGTALMVGGVAGRNTAGGQIGTLTVPGQPTDDYRIAYMPRVECSAAALTVGGVAGVNEGADGRSMIVNVTARGLSFKNFENYRYLGAVAGENRQGAEIADCTVDRAEISKQRTGAAAGSAMGDAAGNCYGGVVGKNGGNLSDCRIRGISVDVPGVYTATATSTAKEKEALSTHVGGIAGLNEEAGRIEGCLIDSREGTAVVSSRITVASGMAGGIAGYNKGSIELSGDGKTQTLMKAGEEKIDSVQPLRDAAKDRYETGKFVAWSGNSLEQQRYSDNTSVTSGRTLLLEVSANGNLGGITAYNAPTGSVNYCATGNWYLNNKSEAIGVGTGGVIGMNESERNLSFLFNQAFVGRQIKSGDTNRFAGGIIGNQNNTTSEGWAIQDCVNRGMVYGRNTHYAGGIIGQWTGRGGNVERCYNYGNLQTTYQIGWLGAAAGIVAQLYHAYEGNEYNITGCGNYGDIYGQNGTSNASCANDSAGILGNITAYRVESADNGQRYAINVIDCVNGAGVRIYSGSMASGIVGFFSCDKPDAAAIANSTANIALNIERCRNYAAVLNGQQFVAGIFGDRYGDKGSRNTTIKYCFSLNRGSGGYNKLDFPVISYNTGTSSPGAINGGGNATYNYFLSENDIVSFQQGGRTQIGVNNNQDKNNLKRANAMWVYSVPNPSDASERYFFCLNQGNVISVNNIQFSGSKFGDKIYNNRNSEIGYFLFTARGYNSMNDVVARWSGFDEVVRRLCYEMANMLLAPERILLSKTGDRQLAIQVEASAYPEGDVSFEAVLYRKNADGTTESVPLSQIILGDGVTAGTGDSFLFSANTCELFVTEAEAQKGGELYVEVKAVQESGGDRKESQPVQSNTVSMERELPDPQLRIELVESGSGYQYRYRLANQDDYADYMDKNLQVSVRFMNGDELVFDADGTGVKPQAVDSLQQLSVQVKSQDQSAASAQVSIPVNLPAYKPAIPLKGETAQEPICTVTGDSLEDLRILVTIPGQGGSVTTPPVYRAELIGTWKDAAGNEHKDTVFGSQDILTTASGQATAVFADLPSYIADAGEAAEIRVRLWYAESGLGPVYTYYELAGGAGNANVRQLIGTPDGAGGYTYEWKYAYTPVLNGNGFQDYRWTSGELLRFLPAPKLMELPQGQKTLTPETAATGRLQYTFRWDEDTYQPGNQYLVSLKGLVEDGDGNITGRVSILTDQAVAGNSVTVDAEDWPYGKVELTVTRKGVGGTTKEIGQTSSKVYPVKRRLPQPAQPRVYNLDVNELAYAIEWEAVTPETGCDRYEVYVQAYEDDGNGNMVPGSADKVDEVYVWDPVAQAPSAVDGVYRRIVDLEAYAGIKVLVYIKAQPAPTSEDYIHSLDGITYGMTVPRRIGVPQVTWTKNWEHRKDESGQKETVSTVEEFQNGGLVVDVTAQPDSIPPGGSSYLLKAYVFEDAQSAEAAKGILGSGAGTAGAVPGLLDTYPASGTGLEPVPAQMESMDSSGARYSHGMAGLLAKYAGRYLLCYARISSGQGNVSSAWVDSGVWQLPYVKLPTPAVAADSMDSPVNVTLITNPDLDTPAEEESAWTASHTILKWDSVDYANVYRFALTAEETGEDGQVTEVTQEYRLVEDAAGPVLYWKNPEGGYEEIVGNDGFYELPQYQREIEGQYEKETDYVVPYRVTLKAGLQVESLADDTGKLRYTLILPDASSLSPQDGGNRITDSSLRFTRLVRIEADVLENEPPGESEAYVRSDPYEIQFQN